MTMTTPLPLPLRRGTRPQTTAARVREGRAHAQLSDTAPLVLQEELVRRAQVLPGVALERSLVSVPGARAFMLDEALARGPEAAFQREREFAHIHPVYDGSLHVTLPPPLAADVEAAGWGEPHPTSGSMMIYGPRDADELEVVWALLRASYDYACGPEPAKAA